MSEDIKLKPGSVVLGDIVHFEPTNAFLEWMKAEYPHHRCIIEVGAGTGHLAAILSRMYDQVFALDICGREASEHHILMEDATEFYYTRRAVVIMARPSHGEWIEKTILKAFITDADCVLYVSLEKNVDRDLGNLDGRFFKSLVLQGAGEAGEAVWRIRRRKETTAEKEFWLVQQRYSRSWYLPIDGLEPYGQQRLNNEAGGYCYMTSTDKILEKVMAENFEDLDWTKTSLLRPDSKTGWLAPDGRWWGCYGSGHDIVADLILHSTDMTLRAQGYARVYSNNVVCDKELTLEQRKILEGMKHQGLKPVVEVVEPKIGDRWSKAISDLRTKPEGD